MFKDRPELHAPTHPTLASLAGVFNTQVALTILAPFSFLLAGSVYLLREDTNLATAPEPSPPANARRELVAERLPEVDLCNETINPISRVAFRPDLDDPNDLEESSSEHPLEFEPVANLPEDISLALARFPDFTYSQGRSQLACEIEAIYEQLERSNGFFTSDDLNPELRSLLALDIYSRAFEPFKVLEYRGAALDTLGI